MLTGPFRRYPRASISIAAMVGALAFVEVLLRAATSLYALHEGLFFYPDLASSGWKRVFLEAVEAASTGEVVASGLEGDVHHPVLGWDSPGGIRGVSGREEKPVDGFRVVAVGDSFTYGAEVAADAAYPARLQVHVPGSEVINMGVRAFGVGQSFLKLASMGVKYSPDVILFGIYGPDYERTPLTFYRYAKPVYRPSPDRERLKLENVPVPPPVKLYSGVRSEVGPLSWTFALVRNRVLRSSAWLRWSRREELYRWRTDYTHELIFREAQRLAKSHGAELFFVYIPDWREFRDPLTPMGWHRRTFRRLFNRVGARFIDLKAELSRNYDWQRIREDFYTADDDGVRGHFSTVGNDAVAQVIAQRVRR